MSEFIKMKHFLSSYCEYIYHLSSPPDRNWLKAEIHIGLTVQDTFQRLKQDRNWMIDFTHNKDWVLVSVLLSAVRNSVECSFITAPGLFIKVMKC